MWAVKNRDGILAVFNDRDEAEQFCREWRSFHGGKAWISRTER
jgi:hypothetical protein